MSKGRLETGKSHCISTRGLLESIESLALCVTHPAPGPQLPAPHSCGTAAAFCVAAAGRRHCYATDGGRSAAPPRAAATILKARSRNSMEAFLCLLTERSARSDFFGHELWERHIFSRFAGASVDLIPRYERRGGTEGRGGRIWGLLPAKNK